MHNICYDDFDEKMSTEKIVDCVRRAVHSSGDGYGTERVRFIHKVMDNYDEAVKFLRENDDKWYGGVAVKFKYFDVNRTKDDKKVVDAQEKLNALNEKKNKFVKEHSVKNFKADYIGCSHCGSKISRKHLMGETCPVCRADLRSVSVLEKIKGYTEKCKEASEAVKRAQDKAVKEKDKDIRWLVKYEYHS